MEKFKKKFKHSLKENASRASALEHYFSSGGIVRVEYPEGRAPSLVYPTKLRLRRLIKEKQSSLSELQERKARWEKKLKEAQLYNLMHGLRKFSQPLYWQHVSKSALDKDYRENAAKVGLPVHLVSDKRWQPMIRMFVHDEDYRRQLTETVQNSIVYKKDKKVARYAKDLQLFRQTESARKLAELGKKISSLREDVSTLRELMKWAGE